jgi:hypothetical protein
LFSYMDRTRQSRFQGSLEEEKIEGEEKWGQRGRRDDNEDWEPNEHEMNDLNSPTVSSRASDSEDMTGSSGSSSDDDEDEESMQIRRHEKFQKRNIARLAELKEQQMTPEQKARREAKELAAQQARQKAKELLETIFRESQEERNTRYQNEILSGVAMIEGMEQDKKADGAHKETVNEDSLEALNAIDVPEPEPEPNAAPEVVEKRIPSEEETTKFFDDLLILGNIIDNDFSSQLKIFETLSTVQQENRDVLYRLIDPPILKEITRRSKQRVKGIFDPWADKKFTDLYPVIKSNFTTLEKQGKFMLPIAKHCQIFLSKITNKLQKFSQIMKHVAYDNDDTTGEMYRVVNYKFYTMMSTYQKYIDECCALSPEDVEELADPEYVVEIRYAELFTKYHDAALELRKRNYLKNNEERFTANALTKDHRSEYSDMIVRQEERRKYKGDKHEFTDIEDPGFSLAYLSKHGDTEYDDSRHFEFQHMKDMYPENWNTIFRWQLQHPHEVLARITELQESGQLDEETLMLDMDQMVELYEDFQARKVLKERKRKLVDNLDSFTDHDPTMLADQKWSFSNHVMKKIIAKFGDDHAGANSPAFRDFLKGISVSLDATTAQAVFQREKNELVMARAHNKAIRQENHSFEKSREISSQIMYILDAMKENREHDQWVLLNSAFLTTDGVHKEVKNIYVKYAHWNLEQEIFLEVPMWNILLAALRKKLNTSDQVIRGNQKKYSGNDITRQRYSVISNARLVKAEIMILHTIVCNEKMDRHHLVTQALQSSSKIDDDVVQVFVAEGWDETEHRFKESTNGPRWRTLRQKLEDLHDQYEVQTEHAKKCLDSKLKSERWYVPDKLRASYNPTSNSKPKFRASAIHARDIAFMKDVQEKDLKTPDLKFLTFLDVVAGTKRRTLPIPGAKQKNFDYTTDKFSQEEPPQEHKKKDFLEYHKEVCELEIYRLRKWQTEQQAKIKLIDLQKNEKPQPVMPIKNKLINSKNYKYDKLMYDNRKISLEEWKRSQKELDLKWKCVFNELARLNKYVGFFAAELQKTDKRISEIETHEKKERQSKQILLQATTLRKKNRQDLEEESSDGEKPSDSPEDKEDKAEDDLEDEAEDDPEDEAEDDEEDESEDDQEDSDEEFEEDKKVPDSVSEESDSEVRLPKKRGVERTVYEDEDVEDEDVEESLEQTAAKETHETNMEIAMLAERAAKAVIESVRKRRLEQQGSSRARKAHSTRARKTIKQTSDNDSLSDSANEDENRADTHPERTSSPPAQRRRVQPTDFTGEENMELDESKPVNSDSEEEDEKFRRSNPRDNSPSFDPDDSAGEEEKSTDTHPSRISSPGEGFDPDSSMLSQEEHEEEDRLFPPSNRHVLAIVSQPSMHQTIVSELVRELRRQERP